MFPSTDWTFPLFFFSTKAGIGFIFIFMTYLHKFRGFVAVNSFQTFFQVGSKPKCFSLFGILMIYFGVLFWENIYIYVEKSKNTKI